MRLFNLELKSCWKMIKIQEHLNRIDAEAYLDILAKSHWVSLNPKLANSKGLRQNSLVEKCKKFKKQTQLKAYLIKYANNDLNALKRQRAFFSFLLSKKYTQLIRIVISRPNQFSLIKTDILKILQPTDLVSGVPGNYSQTPFGSLLSDNIFNYTAFRGSDFCKELFTKIGFDSTTCPYCNDNKINIVKLKSNSSKTTKLKAYLDLDHFYSKSQHPYFAVSFFNLIPTCHDCNSGDKGDKPFTIETHIHPYYEAFDDFYKFKISLKVLLGDPVDYIDIEKLPLKPLDITLTDLNLTARYNTNLPQVQKLVKFFIDNKHHVGTANESMFIDAIFDLNSGIPKDRKDILKSQRGKMSRDTLKQIDIANVLNIT